MTLFSRLSPQDKVVAAISGGMDSMVMLSLLVEQGFRPVVAHFDHQIRPESPADAEFVRQAASRLNLEFHLGQADVPAEAASHKLGLEEVARQLRYAFLFSVCQSVNAQALLVAHTRDDQVETVMMHLLRGAGLDGLRGMTEWTLNVFPGQNVPIYRPLLNWPRNRVEQYCQKSQVTYRQDASNADPRYFRNRLRSELIPLMDALNPASREHIARFAELAGEEVEWMNDLTADAWERSVENLAPNALRLRLPVWMSFVAPLRHRVLRQAVRSLLPDERDVGSRLIETLDDFCQHGTRSGRIALNDCLQARRGADWVDLFTGEYRAVTPWIALADQTLIALSIPGEIMLANGWRMQAEYLDPGENWPAAQDGELIWAAALDADSLTGEMVLRGWQPGERYQILGLRGKRIKLSDLFINAKIPQEARKTWPVVVCGNQIVWVPGFAPAFQNRIAPQTRRVVRLSVGQTAD